MVNENSLNEMEHLNSLANINTHRCFNCDSYENVTTFNNFYICDNCLSNETDVCMNCHTRIWCDDRYVLEDDTTLCQNCYNENYHFCERCQRDILIDNIEEDNNGNYICRDCLRQSNNQQNLRFQEIEIPFKKIPSKSFKQNPIKNFVGIEIECLNEKRGEKQFKKNDCLKFNISQIHDGSLDCNKGIEFNTSAINGDLFLKNTKNICNELKKREFYINSNCGLHIHIGIVNRIEEIKKIWLFYNKFEDFFFKMVSQSRRNNKFCLKIDKILTNIKDDDVLSCKTIQDFKKLLYNDILYNYRGNTNQKIKECIKHKYNPKRYSWVNFHSIFFQDSYTNGKGRGTLEIRIHNGTINAEKINNFALINLYCVDFCSKQSVDFIKEMPKDFNLFLSIFPQNLREYVKQRINKFNDALAIEEN